MRKISELKNEAALEVFADIMEPLTTICADPEFREMVSNKKTTKLDVIRWAIKAHPKDVILIMAIIDGEPVETYQISFVSLPMRILEIVNDKELASLFTSQGQMIIKTSSGSATENIEASEN